MGCRLRCRAALLFFGVAVAVGQDASSCSSGSFVASVADAAGAASSVPAQNATEAALAAVLATTGAVSINVTLCAGCGSDEHGPPVRLTARGEPAPTRS